jgi:hypothetical protein
VPANLCLPEVLLFVLLAGLPECVFRLVTVSDYNAGMKTACSSVLLVVLVFMVAPAQQVPEPKKSDQPAGQSEPATQAPEQKPEAKKYLSPTQRLQMAKTVYMKHGGGSDLPFEVIQSAMESWARYMLVDSPEKADLIVEVQAPEDTSGAQVTTKVSTDERGKQQSSTTTSKSLSSVLMIKMTVIDPHTKVALWSGTERPKNPWRESARQESQVESARKLMNAFHDRVEPENAPEQPK